MGGDELFRFCPPSKEFVTAYAPAGARQVQIERVAGVEGLDAAVAVLTRRWAEPQQLRNL